MAGQGELLAILLLTYLLTYLLTSLLAWLLLMYLSLLRKHAYNMNKQAARKQATNYLTN